MKPTNRRKLPGADREQLAQAMHDVLDTSWVSAFPSSLIDVNPVDIRNIAKQYKEFFEKCLSE